VTTPRPPKPFTSTASIRTEPHIHGTRRSPDGTGAQQWQIKTNGSLVNPESGKCLDDPNSTTTSGTQLQLYTCNSTSAQDWTLPS
jgi:Ricin-type beta-trefoil lectin domain-like